jgi:hypothetical protein
MRSRKVFGIALPPSAARVRMQMNRKEKTLHEVLAEHRLMKLQRLFTERYHLLEVEHAGVRLGEVMVPHLIPFQ